MPTMNQEKADELQERIEDDFDYVVAGIERLEREGQFDAAIDIMEKIADTLDAAIGVIGEDFVSEEDFDEEIYCQLNLPNVMYSKI